MLQLGIARLLLAALLALAAWPAAAQDNYPSRPITLILPYAAGGGTDAIARVLAKTLEAKLGGAIVVENRPGAGGNMATDAVAAAPPDGYTLMIGNQGPMVVTPHLFKAMKSDPEKTLEPIGLVAEAALVVVVGPRLPVTSLDGLIKAAKAKSGDLTYASASNASASHLAALLLERAAGFKARHVAYRGAGPALNDLVGGHVDFMITTIPSVTGLIESGKVTALAVTGATRAEALPKVPTAAEAGLDGYTASTWYGLLAPTGTPAEIVGRYNQVVNQILATPKVREGLLRQGLSARGGPPEQFAQLIAKEQARWAKVVKDAGIAPE